MQGEDAKTVMKNTVLIKKGVCFGLIFLVMASHAYASKRLTVSVNSAIVRTGPGTKYDIAWENLDRNYPLEQLNKKGDWYYVRDYENDVGWIHRSNVSSWDSVITKKDNCNIRSGPGTGNSVVFVVNNGVPFKVLKRKGKWIKIQHADGDSGWIYQTLVW